MCGRAASPFHRVPRDRTDWMGRLDPPPPAHPPCVPSRPTAPQDILVKDRHYHIQTQISVTKWRAPRVARDGRDGGKTAATDSMAFHHLFSAVKFRHWFGSPAAQGLAWEYQLPTTMDSYNMGKCFCFFYLFKEKTSILSMSFFFLSFGSILFFPSFFFVVSPFALCVERYPAAIRGSGVSL